MCAIAGILGMPATQPIIDRMLDTMRRRGPDGQGVYQKGDTTLLHTRLAIIDPEGGAQPMTLQYAGERYTLTYNGELYNTQELRHDLLARGHRFRGHSDTEVVLHAYGEYGAECVNKLNGIFAFAVWEENRQRLFLARDRIGVKPLFYGEQGSGLIFASEIKTLLAHPDIRPRLDARGAAEILLLGPGRIPGSGVFQGIASLEPGHWAYWEKGKLQLHRYWYLRDREHTDSFPETAESVRWLVADAIRRQTVSDVPLGTFLSGGLDSSIITAVCAEAAREKGERLHTFSVDYLNNDRYFTPGKFQPNSDSDYIGIMAEAADSLHHTVTLTPEQLLDVLEDATIARDLPGMADVDFSLLAFCRQVRPWVKVALSGECADEIFGGYPWFRDPEVRAREGFPWAQNSTQRCALLHPDLRRQLDPMEYIMDQYQDTCRASDILPGTSPQERRMKEMVNLNFRWFMQTLLDRKDRMSMYSGLEVRVPFCDWRIAEYLYGVPWEYKDYQGKEKGLLRYAMQGLLPQSVLWRKKSPYPKTHDPKYAQLVLERFQAMCALSDAPVYQLIPREKLISLPEVETPWPWYGQLMAKPQTLAYMLQIDSWLRQYHVQVVS